MDQLQAAGQQLHVAGKGPVSVVDRKATPTDPFGAGAQIVVDLEHAALGAVASAAGGVEAVEIGDQKRATGPQHPRHFADRRLDPDDVDQGQIDDDQIEEAPAKGRFSAIARM